MWNNAKLINNYCNEFQVAQTNATNNKNDGYDASTSNLGEFKKPENPKKSKSLNDLKVENAPNVGVRGK